MLFFAINIRGNVSYGLLYDSYNGQVIVRKIEILY